MILCKVYGCRYANTHVTNGHKCGKCNQFGHGQIECNNEQKCKALDIYIYDKMPNSDYCQILNCSHPHLHKTDAHCCRYCGKHNRHMKHCPIVKPIYSYDDPKFVALDITDQIKNTHIEVGHYIITDAGMGCTWYVRNNNNQIEYFLLHSDSQGQYGEDTSDIPKLNAFLYNFKWQ
jgi:hypothetical protein